MVAMAEDARYSTPSLDHDTVREEAQEPSIGNKPLAPSELLQHLPPSTSVDLVAEGPSPGPAEEADTIVKSSSQTPKPTGDSQGRPLNPRSCVTCRKRKVRCDKTHPCNNCRRANIECVFPAPGRAPRKPRKAGDGRDKELLERLRKLERVVKGLGAEVPGLEKESEKDSSDHEARERAGGSDVSIVVSKALGCADGQSTRASEVDFQNKTNYIEEQKQSRFETRFGRLVINEGRSRYINNSFWANLSNEVEDLKGILNQSSDEEDDNSPGSDEMLATRHQGWIFSFSSQSVDMLNLHPLPNQISNYWEVYKDRVDPLVKVLHLPTLEPTVLSAASHLSNLSKAFEVLMFAIYYAAVTSLPSADCGRRFGEEKPVLLARYRFAVEQALARASFLTTEEAVVLQGFVVFLTCLRRNCDARVIWTLTGLVVRIAQTMGIHRDGLHFGLPPFEVEMRRRLWWQVCLLDIRASEDHGCDPTIIEQAFDTKLPLNINDVDIWPGIKEYPPERQGCTDMSFCLIRFEVSNTFRRINYIPPGSPRACQEHLASVTLQDKEKWITECHRRLEERYLKHCDMTVPLFWVTATVARLMMSKMWLMVYHPFQRQDGGASLPAETKEKLFIISLENIEYSLLLETESRTRKWGWLFRTYMQWHALAFMLSELCHRTTGDLVERAWTAVEQTRDGRWGSDQDDSRAGHLWRPLKKLYSKARDARARGLQEEQLAKNRSNGSAMQQERRYSPNANPMFGHPRRPQMTRAPLSQAQLRRFTEGPSFGQIPVDKHELMKSPRLIDAAGSSETDLTAAGPRANNAPASQLRAQSDDHLNNTSTTYYSEGTGQRLLAPASQPPGLLEPPGFGSNFMAGMNIDFNATPGGSAYRGGTRTNSSPNPPYDPSMHNDTLHMTSMDSNYGLDPTIMDTTDDLNWENWDSLVQQFGMDLDQTFDHRSPAPPGVDGMEGGGSNWNGAMYWGQGTAPGKTNIRSGGFGMDSGDNFW